MATFLGFSPLYLTNFTTPIVSTKVIPHPIGFTLSSPLPFPTRPLAEAEPFLRKQPPSLTTTRALRQWQEYEEAVKDKDLARALRFLQDIPVEPHNSSIDSAPSRVVNGELGLFGLDKDWEVLDTCLNADDMRLVGSAYAFLKDRGLLPNFGKYRNIVLEGPRDVTPIVLKSSTGLEAFLMGCPIRGVILDPIVAMQMGIQGQAGTQFWDEKLQNELAEGRLSGTAFDRYCMVLFAGIAAEALVYGEAEGGENDENLFRSVCVLLEPPLSKAQMSNQARWSVLQSYNLLKWHKHAHRAAVKALESGGSLSQVIRSIEDAMSSGK
ncbi:unnamed protein product [Ilex paraguariensis]|uniref:Uncharacterized protein n=1 Tax=Ilex paraguariensis TaxID=185542 RepID=A0ABC8SJV2_9AQUA